MTRLPKLSLAKQLGCASVIVFQILRPRFRNEMFLLKKHLTFGHSAKVQAFSSLVQVRWFSAGSGGAQHCVRDTFPGYVCVWWVLKQLLSPNVFPSTQLSINKLRYTTGSFFTSDLTPLWRVSAELSSQQHSP
ncbi:hypothetical protein AMECASPLE_024509 [Ameca splendens]|uniref:Uncharacterized protein n=1 Tax=Ameca splendens TaxID=208324 RepID=A0ABV0ZRH2_9TELE